MSLIKKIQNKDANVGVIGLGYVGLPLSMEFVRAGFNVTGIDIDSTKITSLKNNHNYIQDVNDQELSEAIKSGKLNATSDFSVLNKLDTVSICVPTPLNKQKDPDISYINNVIEKLKDFIHQDMLIILESTTYPGTTRELILPELESSGLKIGTDFFLCFSPERIDPGNKDFGTANTPKVIGGITKACSIQGTALYETIVDKVVSVSSPESAEMVKLLENTFRAINIGLANEMAIMCEKLGVDVWEVIEAAATKPFGFMKFLPGPGLGGHCIPIDPHYLSWKLKALDYDARFIQLAGEINTSMPNHVINLIIKGLNRKQKSIKGSKILIVGVSYKKNVNDVRESPALDVIKLLNNNEALTYYYDPLVPSIQINDKSIDGQESITSDFLLNIDAVIIITDHDCINFDFIAKHSDLIIDTRNIIKTKSENIIRLGVGI